MLEADRPRPDIKNFRQLLAGPFGIKSWSLGGLLVLAAFAALYLARGFFLPLVLALLLSFLLSPLVRGMKKLHIPEALGAAVVVLTLLGGLGVGIYELGGPAPHLDAAGSHESAQDRAPGAGPEEARADGEQCHPAGGEDGPGRGQSAARRAGRRSEPRRAAWPAALSSSRPTP